MRYIAALLIFCAAMAISPAVQAFGFSLQEAYAPRRDWGEKAQHFLALGAELTPGQRVRAIDWAIGEWNALSPARRQHFRRQFLARFNAEPQTRREDLRLAVLGYWDKLTLVQKSRIRNAFQADFPEIVPHPDWAKVRPRS